MARFMHLKNKIIIINISKYLYGAHYCWNLIKKQRKENEKNQSLFSSLNYALR